MMKIEHVSIKDYYSKDRGVNNDIIKVLKFGKFKAVDHFKIGDITEKTFGFVKDLQYLFGIDLTIDVIAEFLSDNNIISNEDFFKTSIFHFRESQEYLRKQVEGVNKIERDFLGSSPTVDEVNAGIDRFGKYGSFIQLDSLACGVIAEHKVVRALPYSVCFAKLELNFDKAEYERDLNKIFANKNS